LKVKQMIGLCGAHRTGKTILAGEYAGWNPSYDFVATSTSEVFKTLGFDPKQKLTFKERLFVQEEVLTQAIALYGQIGDLSILDRTPIDYAGYLLSECLPHELDDELSERVAVYIDRCLTATSENFSTIVLVQPGITTAPNEDGKAIISKAYQEHLNAIMLGLLMDERVEVFKAVIPRNQVNLEERVAALTAIIRNIKQEHNRRQLDRVLH
jgi:hypothetical protein